MAVEIKGYNELLAKFNKLAELKGVESGMQKSCALVERAAKQKAPKDTGELKRSISSRVINEGQAIIGEIFTQLEYAPYIEYGTGLFAESGGRTNVPWNYKDDKGEWHTTSCQKPQPYMRPALIENKDKITKNNEIVLTADNSGVDAKKLHATTYLIIGRLCR